MKIHVQCIDADGEQRLEHRAIYEVAGAIVVGGVTFVILREHIGHFANLYPARRFRVLPDSRLDQFRVHLQPQAGRARA